MEIWDQSSCEECGDREGSLCWFIVLLLFFAMIIVNLALFLQIIRNAFGKPKYYQKILEQEKKERRENPEIYDDISQNPEQDHEQGIMAMEPNSRGHSYYDFEKSKNSPSRRSR